MALDPFRFAYTVCLADTDAAGVVYFTRLLEICHRAYEAALAAAGIGLAPFLARDATSALPIVGVRGRFLAPLRCGDNAIVTVCPSVTDAADACSYSVDYQILLLPRETPVAIARTDHVCIDPHQRQRQPLPASLRAWVADRD